MFQLIINGLAVGSIYALVALGLLLIYNAVKVASFAQGQLLMVGAYIGVTADVDYELPTAAAYSLTLIAMAGVGLAFMVIAYFPLRGKATHLVILTTIAFGIVLENLVLNIAGPLPVSLSSPSSALP